MNQEKKPSNIAEHLANERTLLAWVRTAIGIMAFGFVVVKFSLFVRQFSIMLGQKTFIDSSYSSPIGILLVCIGALSLLLSLYRYRVTEKQIKSGSFNQSSTILHFLVGLVFLISIILITYLFKTA